MTLREAKAQVHKWVTQYPALTEEITGFWELCQSEIEEGGVESQEIDLMFYDVKELIEEWESSERQSRP